MKKIKKFNLLMILTFVLTAFSFMTPTYAAGSATVGFNGNSTVPVGSTIELKMYVSNVSNANGGVVSLESNLVFDSSYLEYVSGTGTRDPYMFQINTNADYKIAGLDTTLEYGITGSGQTTVFTFKFKALKEGVTNVSLSNVKLTDTDGRLTANAVAKQITIGGSTTTKSNDATLKSLGADGYSLSPNFSASNTNYTITVPEGTNTVKLTGSANHGKASVSGLGDITLTGDNTTAKVVVTAEDGTQKTYNVTIKKGNGSTSDPVDGPTLSSDATLKKLDVSGFTLNPRFKSSVNNYAIKVKNNITSLNITAIPTSDKAKVSISGNKNWKVGVNVVTIKVTAEDGTVNSYIVNVTREDENGNTPSEDNKKSSDNFLKSLIINSSHEISPKFDKNVSSYNVIVPNEVEKLDLSYITSNSKAKVQVNGNGNFKTDGVNTVEIVVTAEDGTIRSYVLNVTRSSQSSENDLKDIVIDGVDLNPTFKPNVLEYDVKVPAGVDKLDIKVNPVSSDAKVEIIGNENLKEGKNTVLVKVTDKNGFTKYYTLNVEKEETRILGLTPFQFGVISAIIGGLLLLTMFLLLWKRKKHIPVPVVDTPTPVQNPGVTPIIVKPEFNFGSKNTSDDDVVHGNFNQGSNLTEGKYEEPKQLAIDANYEEVADDVYDPYDEVVTKDELIDAIQEAKETRDSSKLQMLLDQEELNRRKEELKREENRNRYDDTDDWR